MKSSPRGCCVRQPVGCRGKTTGGQPRYTGRQVWNRQRTDHDDIEPDGAIARHGEVQRWNAAPHWVISRQIAHPPLVTEEQFVAAQAIHTAPPRRGSNIIGRPLAVCSVHPRLP
ncbi:recombinase family protein [Micromonospora chersina]|uniref:recombinase family protein n=1 Tax=Micromonospora chersina TaxID=47854 RepID=UPI0037AD3753